MDAEKNIIQEQEMHFIAMAETLKKKFTSRRINFYACSSVIEAQKTLTSLVEAFKSNTPPTQVGFSDSVTLHQMNAYDTVGKIPGLSINNPLERNNQGIYTIFGDQPDGKLNLPKEEYYALMEKLWQKMRETLLSDIFIIGANAITMNGQIVSTDGTGNRVGGMIFGPRKVIIVVGRNKITRNLEDAIRRNRDIAAPLNYHRHNIKHHNRFDNPCMKTGYCSDCNSPRRGCLKTVIIDGEMEGYKDRTHLILINQDLGL
ncbi:MAG TPA: LUD domain-containing protein [Bacteroidales bacterium]|nr:LUD domain-containing protein [Bacteroidales bacterium]HQP04396.1 LUD domain-containing protein [Bacteroidales bacterium]